MEDGRCVAVFWVEPNTEQYVAWVRPDAAGGSGGGVADSSETASDVGSDVSPRGSRVSNSGSAASVPLDSAQGTVADRQNAE